MVFAFVSCIGKSSSKLHRYSLGFSLGTVVVSIILNSNPSGSTVDPQTIGFELHWSTYMQSFFNKYYAIRGKLVKSADMEDRLK